MAKCRYKNCNEKVKCKDLCHKHYNKQNYHKHIEKRRLYDKSPRRRFAKFLNYCKINDIDTDITYDFWFPFIEANKCFYCCGPLPTNGYGLDRKNPKLGYFKTNVVSCCERCNFTKRDEFTHEEFLVMMLALKEYRERKRL